MSAAARRASYGTREYGYDQFGQLALVKFRNQSDGAWHSEQAYSWDARGRMLAVQVFDPATDALQASIAYSYDTAGGLVRRQAAGQAAERYLLDDQNPSGLTQPVAELDETATHCNRGYTWGGSLIAQHDAATGTGGAARTLYAHSDRLGSARLLTTSDGGAQAGSGFNYDPYGRRLAGADATVTPFAFTGQRGENATPQPLQYHRARWYSPQTANWTSRDTLFDFPGNFGNPYAYAGANPACKSDPSGQFEISEMMAVASIIGESTAIDVAAGIDIIRVANGQEPRASSMVLGLIEGVGLIGLSFIPVLGFIISVFQLPSAISEIFAGFRQVAASFSKGNTFELALGFGRIVIGVLGVAAAAIGIIKAIKLLRPLFTEAWRTIIAFSRDLSEGNIAFGGIPLPSGNPQIPGWLKGISLPESIPSAQLQHAVDRHCWQWFNVPKATVTNQMKEEFTQMIIKAAQSDLVLPGNLTRSQIRTVVHFQQFGGKWLAVHFSAEGSNIGKLVTAYAASAEQLASASATGAQL